MSGESSLLSQPPSDTTPWREVSILTPPELVEAISNFLIDEESRGVVIEDLEENGIFADRKKMGWLWVRAYYPGKKMAELKGRLELYLKELAGLFPYSEPPVVDMRSLPEEDWSHCWKHFFTPIQVTPNLLVKPSWHRCSIPKGMDVVILDPGMAFGTGKHPTTRLCIRALYETFFFQQEGVTLPQVFNLLDVGTGSGIIALCAAKMGIPRVMGIDIDPIAVEVARKNVQLNHLEKLIEISEEPIDKIQEKFDVVVANLTADILYEIRQHLKDRLSTNGFLIVSGISRSQGAFIKREFLKLHLNFHSVLNSDDFSAIVFSQK